MKALRIAVYKNELYKGCSNNGISEKFNELLLVCEDGNVDVDENNLPENLVVMVSRQLFGKEYKHIEPYTKPTGAGWMSGGAVAYSCDSRFGKLSDYPLSIHDRQETQKQYDMLSN